MKLEINTKGCEGCNDNCLQNCPMGLSIKNIRCEHCSPETAACFNACGKNAIFECAKGILSIDPKKCDGCGACISACTYGAISIVRGKARKCDLCFSKSFMIECIKNCKDQAIKLVKSRQDIQKVEETLGWNLHDLKYKKIVKDSETFQIVENEDNDKAYFIKNIDSLSGEEAEVLNCLLKEFRIQPNADIKKFIEWKTGRNNIELDERQIENFVRIINAESSSFGILKFLIENERLEEISGIGIGKQNEIFVYDKTFGWLKTNLYFSKEETLRELINKMARTSGRRLSLKNPKINAVLENGDRLNACISPIAFSGINFTIRKFKRNPLTPIDLVRLKTVSAECLAFLWLALQTNCSLIVCGNTGSGKTTTLNALFSFMPQNDRIIITEETPEINVPQKHVVKLNTSENVKMSNLIIETLRMRPDRVIVGEMRNRQETNAFMDTILAGQGKGSFATFHAQSADECLARLRSFGIEANDLQSIDLVMVQKRWDKNNIGSGIKQDIRRVSELAEIENNKTKKIFEYSYSKDKVELKSLGKRLIAKMQNCYSSGKKELENEFIIRTKLLEKMALRNEQLRLLDLCTFFSYFEGKPDFRKEVLDRYEIN